MVNKKNNILKTDNSNNTGMIIVRNTDSSYGMLSTTISRSNLYKAVANNTHVINEINKWLNILNNRAFSLIISEATESLLKEYANSYFIRPDDVINDCLDLIKNPELLQKVVQLKYSVSATVNNLICTFNCEHFISLYNKPDDILDYAHVLWNFIILAIFSNLYENTSGINLKLFNNYVNLNIVTGIRVYAEFQINRLYSALYQELEPVLSNNKLAVNMRKSPEKQTILFKVKNNYILDRAFKDEGYSKTKRSYNDFLDGRSTGEVRIMQGKTANHVRLEVYISGMRTISRLLSLNCDPNQKIYLRSIGANNTGNATDRIISFYFRAILSNCKGKIIKSDFETYNTFIRGYKERTGKKNGIARNTLIAILLSKLTEQRQKEFINSELKRTDKTPRMVVNNDLEAINNLLNEDTETLSTFERFYNDLRRFYAW